MPVAQTTSALEFGLIAAGILLTVLLGALLWMLFGPSERPQRRRQPLPGAGPTLTPPPASFAGPAASVPAEPAPPSGAQPAKTRLYLNLGVELVVERGPDRSKVFPLTQPLTLIGRAGARVNDVELTDGTVSKEQASIRYEATSETFIICNESSTNPTRVNRSVVAADTALEPDAIIEMGGTTLLFRNS